MKLFFTEFEDFPYVAGLEKRFATTNIELLHPSVGEETKRGFSSVQRKEIVVRGGMKAKMALVVADAMREPVHGDWFETWLWTRFRG